ncbi:hypothetical protein H8B09_25930 [Paenibacillus sp. PR3]|uniref:Uncharacterized protein n=1 Tax=Paenibacillus terricola TaxID=2763503 RepID=A0ABR8N486_9BACL|nr:hypothetical protein [Paenibacillus terricola]MBD3922222.1 hypothetical protein [Paenibacillus terricola]
MCEDSSGSEGELWRDTDIYVVDFFEYEKYVGVWFVYKDGNAHHTGFILELDKTTIEYEASGTKGHPLDNINSIQKGDPARFEFDRQIQAAIKHYKCGESGLKSA